MQPQAVTPCGAIVLSFLVAATCAAQGEVATAPLVLEAKISLGDFRGRIDHLAIDTVRQRLYVAELGDNSIGVIDLKANRLIRTIGGFSEPQGVGYEPSTDTVYVSNGGDGSVRLLHGPELQPAGRIELGSDADNIRIDTVHHRVVVGYGDGALAVIDAQTLRVVATIPLKAHPESFQLDTDGRRAYVNVPNAGGITVVDLPARRELASWGTDDFKSNYPMTLDSARQLLWVAFRQPPMLVAFDAKTGARIIALQSCGDADDLFLDGARELIYVSCGAGVIDVWGKRGAAYVQLTSIATVAGARTSLFAPEQDRLYLAVRGNASEPAALWVFRPSPQK